MDVNNRGYGDAFLQSDFDAWYAANAASVTKVGSVYVVNSAANFLNTIIGSNPLNHALGSNFLDGYNKHSVVDMGKEISIGMPSNPRMLVFRQVAIPYDPAAQGSGLIAYIVVENNAVDLTRPRFLIAVARA